MEGRIRLSGYHDLSLHAYSSPYHWVWRRRNLSASLFVCGGKDDRCSPAHVWKMSARLQLRKTQTELHIVVDLRPQERGHCPVSATLSIRDRNASVPKFVAFLCTELGIPVRRGAMS